MDGLLGVAGMIIQWLFIAMEWIIPENSLRETHQNANRGVRQKLPQVSRAWLSPIRKIILDDFCCYIHWLSTVPCSSKILEDSFFKALWNPMDLWKKEVEVPVWRPSLVDPQIFLVPLPLLPGTIQTIQDAGHTAFIHMEVSWNAGTFKSSNLVGFSFINHPFLGYPHE